MARESWAERTFQVFTDMDGALRSGYYPTGNTVEGNVKTDFVWGNIPLQPNDDRDDTSTSIGGGDQDKGWAPTSTWIPDVLQVDDYTVTIGNQYAGFDVKVPADNHINVRNEFNSFPDYAVVPKVVGENYNDGTVTLILDGAGLLVGSVTRTALWNINGEAKIVATEQNRGQVVAQSPRAGDGISASTFVNITVLDPDPSTVDVFVPNLVGQADADAQLAAETLGLVYASTTTDVDATAENDGTVKSQTPAAGALAQVGDTVNVVLYAYVAP